MIDYTGIQCPVCGKPFSAEDDIVVCPECGAPYHRHCYQQEGHCIFSDKHGTGQAWKNPRASRGSSEEKRCPRCGKSNAPGALFCDHCGMSLTEEPPIGPQNNYGQFNSRYGAAPSPTDFPQGQQQSQNPWGQPYGQTPPYGQSSPYGGNGPDGQNPNQPFPGGPAAFFFDPLGGVKPDEDLDGVSAADMAKFVQANTQYYLPVFTNQKKFRRNRFNFCAFLCTGGWMLYRKQYKLGAILTAVMAGIYFLSLYCSYASEDILLRLMSQVGIDLDTMMPSSAQLMQLGSLLAQQPAWELILIFLPRVLNVVQLVIMIITGIKANKIYGKFCTRKIKTIDTNFPEPADREMQLRTQGGVNTPLAVGLMIAYMLAVYLPRLWLLI